MKFSTQSRLLLLLALNLVAFDATLDLHAQGWMDKVKKTVKDVQTAVGSSALSEEDAAKGIKEALSNGTSKGTAQLAATNGYFGNPTVKIPFPQSASTVENTLRKIGMGSKVDEAVLSINRAAEKAASDAKPIFLKAIEGMTVNDAIGIVKGSQHSATEYLQRSTTAQLQQTFKPVIAKALESVQATRYWSDVMSTYNKVPFVTPVSTDLSEYVTQKAIDGLFVMIAAEEENIRSNPAARVSDLLKRVFGSH